MKFIGVDLGWLSSPTGLCCLVWETDQLKILDFDSQQELEEICAWIEQWVKADENALIAVDAPTLIPNITGMRLPDRLTHKYFGRYHAGCYPANLGKAFAQRTVKFGLELENLGFSHAPTITPQQLGRYQIEVFPHPATINLFNLQRILKYKKGKLAHRKSELDQLRRHIYEILPKRTSSLRIDAEKSFSSQTNPLTCNLAPLKGLTLKAVEDQLDSLICAYVGAHWWYWGLQRNWVLGGIDTGYIVVPAQRETENK